MTEPELIVRGLVGGVLVILPEVEWHRQLSLLISRIQQQERFFKGGRLTLDLRDTLWSEKELLRLLRDLSDEGVCLGSVLGSNEDTIQAARGLGIIQKHLETKDDGSEAPKKPAAQTHWLKQTLNNGETITTQPQTIFMGDILAGARVEVLGDLLVWGTVSGTLNLQINPESSYRVCLLRNKKGTYLKNESELGLPRKARDTGPLEIKIEAGEITFYNAEERKIKLL
ncbi:MAG: hypothetical protein ACOYKD_00480 [Anaerolineaceae bacterium]|jgi:hypothetical protein